MTLTGDVAHYTPTIGRVGVDTFQWTASDGTETSSTATETINLTDSPPVVVSTSFEVTENTPLTIAAPGLLTGASSDGNAPLTVTTVSKPSDGTVTYQPDGSFTYTPVEGFVGFDSFTFVASDGVTSQQSRSGRSDRRRFSPAGDRRYLQHG